MKTTTKRDELIYDVGMHKGEDTDYYLKKGFRVIAFEADPKLAAYCREKFEKEIQNKQLKIIEGAIVDFSGNKKPGDTIHFFQNKGNTVWGTVLKKWAKRNEGFGTKSELITVKTINFSDYLEKYGIPHYLKIDIEGMDTVCLKALLGFQEKPDYISIESERISFQKLKGEFCLFKKLGYDKFQAINQMTVTKQKEPTNSTEGYYYINHSFTFGSTGLFGTDLHHKWKNKRQILNQYRYIFLGYNLFSEYGKLNKSRFKQPLLKIANLLSPTPVPSWYDTHARHKSCEK